MTSKTWAADYSVEVEQVMGAPFYTWRAVTRERLTGAVTQEGPVRDDKGMALDDADLMRKELRDRYDRAAD